MERLADEVLSKLEQHGFPSYKVGGCVRDKLLQLPIHDIDIATAATPEQVLSLFPKVIPTGIKHGTVTVQWKGCSFEVTTFRKDLDYRDHRRPMQVEYVEDIEIDLKRRDFTINAMAMDIRGTLIDPFGGKRDLQGRLIRSVGEPELRFAEDALRILRGVRFSARFGFGIEGKTWQAMLKMGNLLEYISRERIRDEFRKIIESQSPQRGIERLAAENLLPFPAWRLQFQEIDHHPAKHHLTDLDDPAFRWSLILIDQEPETAASLLKAWCFPVKLSQEVKNYLQLLITEIKSDAEGKKLLLSYGREKVLCASRIKRWLHPHLPAVSEEQWDAWDREIPIRSMKELTIQAEDLLGCFHKLPGPWLGYTIRHLFEQVAFHRLPNDRAELLMEARKVNDEYEGTNPKNI